MNKIFNRSLIVVLSVFFVFVLAQRAEAANYYVSTSGSDSNAGTDIGAPWRTVQKAFNSATPGSTVYIRGGTYNESLVLNVSGSASAGYITFQNYNGETAIIDGTGKSVRPFVDISFKHYIKIIGLNFTNYTHDSGIGIHVTGGSDHIEFRNNKISNFRMFAGTTAEVIARQQVAYNTNFRVTGTSTTPNSDIIVDGNEFTNCQEGYGETLTMSGNTTNWEITNNRISGCNKGIDASGLYGDSPNPAYDMARNGVMRGNIVSGITDGIGNYVDCGKDIVIEKNIVYGSSWAAIVTCEKQGAVSTGVVVRDNLYYDNSAGIAVGGWIPTYGTASGTKVHNNTLVNNGTAISVILGSGNSFYNNIISGGGISNSSGNSTNTFNYNLFDGTGAVGSNPISGNPLFTNKGGKDFHLLSGSPAINAGDPSFSTGSGETDFGGSVRLAGGRVDIGAYESGSTVSPTPPPPAPSYPSYPPLPPPPPPSYPSYPPTFLKGDINKDGIVNSLDWSMMNNKWFMNDVGADLNTDGIVNSLDFSILNSNWLKTN